MKKILKFTIYIVIFGMGLLLLTGCNNKNQNTLNQKVGTEISYIDGELIAMANSLNNIEYARYRVGESNTINIPKNGESTRSSGESSEKSSNGEGKSSGGGESNTGEEDKSGSSNGDGEESKSESSSGEQEKSNSESGSSQGEEDKKEEGKEASKGSNQESSQGQGGNGSEQEKSSSSQSSKNGKIAEGKFSMESNNILGKQEDVNWQELKEKTEKLYTTWTTVSIDLGEAGISKEVLNKFSNNMDSLAMATKSEDEQSTINSIIALYELLPKFAEVSDGNIGAILDSKYKLLLCYRYAMLEDWENLKVGVNNLKSSFGAVESKRTEYPGKDINIKSSSVIIGEMENFANTNDKDVFLIKYRNLIQELNIIG